MHVFRLRLVTSRGPRHPPPLPLRVSAAMLRCCDQWAALPLGGGGDTAPPPIHRRRALAAFFNSVILLLS